MILTNGQFPAPTLRLKQGDDVEVLVNNSLPFSTTVHFHGIEQLGTPWSDGVPGLSQLAIEPGDLFLYKWNANNHGIYWYHAHRRGQIDDGLYGALYIQPDDSVERPFSSIADSNSTELQAMLDAETDTQPVMLSDWLQFTSGEVWEYEQETGLDAHCVTSLLINGKGSVQCLPQDTINTWTTDTQKTILNGSSLTDMACVPATNILLQGNYEHNYSAVPQGLFSGCEPSQGPTEVFEVDPSKGYVSWDLISAASLISYAFSIDQHPVYVYAIDGRYINPMLVEAIEISSGSRYSILVPLDQPAGNYSIRLVNAGVNQIINTTAVLSYTTLDASQASPPSQPYIDIVANLTTSNATYLDETQVVPFPVETPAASDQVAGTFILTISHFNASYLWTLGNSSYELKYEDSQPLLFNTTSIPSYLTISTQNGSWIDLIFFVNNSDAIQPPHPIHKHSNRYFVIGQGDGMWNWSSVAEAQQYIPNSFNFDNPQIRDTFRTLTATGPNWMAVRYQVVNPGAFLLHCHIQDHLSGGMALALLDGVDVWPAIPEEYQPGNNGGV
ncbi:hypothetical protein MPDQ_003342 [Monascus purpureus]|uniref:Multicopper oxidase n=1 Tax=Monascus purpureus TaxID=5098 RepID=A0A507QJ44_MONPU|nr:hypothetical protein MPDQ_003342 [Monascus purpureus]